MLEWLIVCVSVCDRLVDRYGLISSRLVDIGVGSCLVSILLVSMNGMLCVESVVVIGLLVLLWVSW